MTPPVWQWNVGFPEDKMALWLHHPIRKPLILRQWIIYLSIFVIPFKVYMGHVLRDGYLQEKVPRSQLFHAGTTHAGYWLPCTRLGVFVKSLPQPQLYSPLFVTRIHIDLLYSFQSFFFFHVLNYHVCNLLSPHCYSQSLIFWYELISNT